MRSPHCLLTTTLMIAALSAGSAMAGDQEIEPIPPEPAATAGEPTLFGMPFGVAFGIALTSNYVSRGITNSGNDPAVQGYIEPNLGIGYLNIWSSNVNFGEGFKGAEIDTALGIWTPLAEQGDAEAQYMLGLIYFNGRFVTKDNDVAAHWLELSAAQGNTDAELLLGVLVPADQADMAQGARK